KPQLESHHEIHPCLGTLSKRLDHRLDLFRGESMCAEHVCHLLPLPRLPPPPPPPPRSLALPFPRAPAPYGSARHRSVQPDSRPTPSRSPRPRSLRGRR